MFRPAVRIATAVALVMLAATACGRTGGEPTVEVRSTASACTTDTARIDAGPTTFRVVNAGARVTELYIRRPSGEVVGEVENVGPGTSRTLSVALAPGRYDVVCKPGQTGSGITQAITVRGRLAETTTIPGQPAIQLVARGYRYIGTVDGLHAGDRVRLSLRNDDPMDHELELFGPDGTKLGEIGPTRPGATGTATFRLPSAGRYRYRCGISDHEQRGMSGTFVVS